MDPRRVDGGDKRTLVHAPSAATVALAVLTRGEMNGTEAGDGRRERSC